MLIILPPSESKRSPPPTGQPVLLDRLSFPVLTETRRQVISALIETSRRPDALRRLMVRPRMVDAVAANVRLLESPTLPVLELFTGSLHEGLDAATLSVSAHERAARTVIIASSLWGALRPVDRIPIYRLHICANLVGLDRLEPIWRIVLPGVLAEAARDRSMVVDLRSPAYQAIGRPTGLADRTVTLRVERQGSPGDRVGDVIAKRVRGQAARLLLESPAPADDFETVEDVLAERWPVHVSQPTRPGKPWTMTLFVAA